MDMRSKSILLLALALGCGLVASIGISQIMEGSNKEPTGTDLQPIFVAMTDVNANDVLTPQVLKLEEWPKKMVPVGALTKLEEVEGKRAKMKLYQGEPILAAKLLGPDESVGAATQIPEGYRVAHVKVDAVTGNSNLILPGDRVDVLVFRNTGDMNAMAAKIVLQDIKVFAVDTHTESEYSRNKSDTSEPMTAKTIALLVTAQQAVVLHAASEISGSVKLVLRNPEDKSHVRIPGATIGDIFGNDVLSDRDNEQTGQKGSERPAPVLEQPKEPVAPALPPSLAMQPVAPPFKMVVVYGSELMEVEFPGDGRLPSNQTKKNTLRPDGLPTMPIPASQMTSGPSDEGNPLQENEDPPTE
jgi:pilus assembly protein CpaB